MTITVAVTIMIMIMITITITITMTITMTITIMIMIMIMIMMIIITTTIKTDKGIKASRPEIRVSDCLLFDRSISTERNTSLKNSGKIH